MEFGDEPQSLYWAYGGRWPFRRLLYVGITNSRKRRLREHGALSEWMSEARTIKFKNYQDRASVVAAEKRTIRSKRPIYNVQHNRGDREIEVSAHEVSAGLAGIGTAACVVLLGTRWAADELSTRWILRRARLQGAKVELPPRRNPFSEPSRTLTLLDAFLSLSSKGVMEGIQNRVPERPVASLQEPVEATAGRAEEVGAGPHSMAMAPWSASTSAWALLFVMCIVCAHGRGAGSADRKGLFMDKGAPNSAD